jgi:hypothetical protein
MAQQQPFVHITESDLPGPNGATDVPGYGDDDREVKPVSLHAPEEGEVGRTVEQERAHWQAAEADILAGLFEAVDEAQVAVAVATFPRFQFPLSTLDGKPVLDDQGNPVTEPMRVRFLKQNDVDIEAAQRRATAWVPNRDVPGGPRVEQVNQARMRSWVIYNATVPEDKAKYWDRKELVNRLRCGNGVEVIDKLLDAGEKLQAVNVIYGHSGLMNVGESEVEQVAKP